VIRPSESEWARLRRASHDSAARRILDGIRRYRAGATLAAPATGGTAAPVTADNEPTLSAVNASLAMTFGDET